VWGKMEGKLGAVTGVAAGCSTDTGSLRHPALTIRDALTQQTLVTDSELY
jgi:hypothetical protein